MWRYGWQWLRFWNDGLLCLLYELFNSHISDERSKRRGGWGGGCLSYIDRNTEREIHTYWISMAPCAVTCTQSVGSSVFIFSFCFSSLPDLWRWLRCMSRECEGYNFVLFLFWKWFFREGRRTCCHLCEVVNQWETHIFFRVSFRFIESMRMRIVRRVGTEEKEALRLTLWCVVFRSNGSEGGNMLLCVTKTFAMGPGGGLNLSPFLSRRLRKGWEVVKWGGNFIGWRHHHHRRRRPWDICFFAPTTKIKMATVLIYCRHF